MTTTSIPNQKDLLKLQTQRSVLPALLLGACVSVCAPWSAMSAAQVVSPVLGTEAMLGGGDRADDPAIWVNSNKPGASIIFGVNKSGDKVNGGVYAFTLDGQPVEQADWEEGVNLFEKGERYNNIDLRYDFKAGSERWDIVCASNRSDREIDVFRVLKTANGDFDGLEHVGEVPIGNGFTGGQDAPYGLGMYHAQELDKHFALTSDKEGRVGQYELAFNPGGLGDNQVTGRRVAGPLQISTDGSEVEGIVADDERKVIYIAAEDQGIYRYSLDDAGVLLNQRVTVADEENASYLDADLEGLALYKSRDGGGYLLSSVQGRSEYAVFERIFNPGQANVYLKNFSLSGVQNTDGLDVNSANFGAPFESGLLVVHDGVGDNPTNYKLAKWEDVARAGSPVLEIDAEQPPQNAPVLSFREDQLSNYSGQHKTGTVFISNQQRNLRITGNSWKKLAFDYRMTANTVLEFEFKADNPGEIVGIGIDSDNNHKNQLSNFQLTGPQDWRNGYSDFRANNTGEFRRVRIPLGSFDTGCIRYLTFIADDDASERASVVFKNLRVFED